MNFEEQLLEWDYFFNKTRQIDHTYSILNGILNTEKAKIVTANQEQNKLFPKNKSICFYSNLKEIKIPVVFDNFTVHNIIKETLWERISKQKIENIIKKIMHQEYKLLLNADPLKNKESYKDGIAMFALRLKQELNL